MSKARSIPLVDLKAQYELIKNEISVAMQRVIEATAFINGPDVKAFEDEFAQFCGASYAVGVGSGTAALQLALESCGVGPGDEVITVSHTFCATVEAILHAGARPVFVDIDPITYTMDPARLEAALTLRTKAILPVHLYGHPADMDPICDIAKRHDLAVIEDAAQAHGALYKGKPVGTLGQAGCFSFYPGKNLGAFGDAGAITTNDRGIAEKVAALRDHGRTVSADGKRAKYEHELVGYGERLDTLQAAVLRAKLSHLPAWNESRRYFAVRYNGLLADSPFILPVTAENCVHVYHLYVIRVQNREAVRSRLSQSSVDSGIHYPIPLHLQPAFSHLGYRQGDLPHTEEAAQQVLSLPIYAELTEEDQNRVVETVLYRSGNSS